MKTYKCLGLMSGSSLDGLDLAYCQFDFHKIVPDRMTWQILEAETMPFSSTWRETLLELPQQSAQAFAEADMRLGSYFGELCKQFIQKTGAQPDFIASHGHTIFHEPARGFSAQIGDGAAIAATTGITTIDQFRGQDIALSGQGAPIAPIADQYLFSGYDFYLNLGGIVNISSQINKQWIAFDVTGANQVLNHLAREKGMEYDKDGQLAAAGILIPKLFEEVSSLGFFKEKYPKSLSNQWVQENLIKIFLESSGSIEDRLHTVVHHIAFQIKQAVHQIMNHEKFKQDHFKILVTGGGAFNSFLLNTLENHLDQVTLEKPDPQVIAFKEALLMAWMGVLRLEGHSNILSSVTGAKRPSIGGAIHAGLV